jgi:hypothetical protein
MSFYYELQKYITCCRAAQLLDEPYYSQVELDELLPRHSNEKHS